MEVDVLRLECECMKAEEDRIRAQMEFMEACRMATDLPPHILNSLPAATYAMSMYNPYAYADGNSSFAVTHSIAPHHPLLVANLDTHPLPPDDDDADDDGDQDDAMETTPSLTATPPSLASSRTSLPSSGLSTPPPPRPLIWSNPVMVLPDGTPVAGSNVGMLNGGGVSETSPPPKQRRSKNDRIHEEREVSARCKSCAVQLGRMTLIGEAQDFLRPFAADVSCCACSPPLDDAGVVGVRGAGKRRRRNGPREIECKVCTNPLGTGGIRLIVDTMQFEGAGAEGAAGMPWVEPEFKVEVVCTSCLSLYRFCSSCGGGSKRSGKWRPKEMFSANRKTCCLSHIRLGDASQFRVVSYRPISDHTGRTMTLDAVQMEGEPMDAIPFANGDPEDRIVAFADLVAEHMHQTVLQINDATMLRGAAFDTWPKMIGRMSDLKSDVTNFIRGRLPHSRDPTRVREHRRYITVIYVPNPKPKGKRRDPSEVVENGRRDWIMVASMLNAWNVEGRHSYTINTGTKGVMQDVKAPAWIVLKHNITRMAVDLSTLPDLIPPLHLSAWAQKGGKWEERIEMVSRQLGLLPLDEYVATRGEECRRVLEEDNFVRGEDRYLKVIFAGPADSKSIIKF